VDHIEQVITAAADAAVADAIAVVKDHPNYQRVVEALAGRALDALTTGL
jgi:hypothetical protein